MMYQLNMLYCLITVLPWYKFFCSVNYPRALIGYWHTRRKIVQLSSWLVWFGEMEYRVQYTAECIVFLVLYIVNIIIGSVYIESCDIDVPAFLIASGSVQLVLIVIEIGLTIYLGPENDIVQLAHSLRLVGGLAFTIWGSILVFGNYSDVTYTRGGNVYCDETPFIYAVVIVILSWIWIPICMCVLWIACIAVCCTCFSNMVWAWYHTLKPLSYRNLCYSLNLENWWGCT